MALTTLPALAPPRLAAAPSRLGAPPDRDERSDRHNRRDRREWQGGARAGFALVMHDRWLGPLTTCTALTFGSFGIVLVADLPLVEHFGAGPVAYALLTTLWGAGAVAGSGAAARWVSPAREPRAVVAGTASMAVSIGSIALLPALGPIILAGCFGGMQRPRLRSLVQPGAAAGPGRTAGRVLAATEAAEQAAFALGMVAGGAVVALVGPQAAYLVPAGMLALGALLVGMTDVPATPPTPRCSVT